MTLGPFIEKHSFLLYDITSTKLLVRDLDLLSKLEGLIHFASSGHFTLEFPDQLQLDLLQFLQSVLDIEKEEFQQTSPNLIEVAENLWASFNTDIE